jgi:hypothetical protein
MQQNSFAPATRVLAALLVVTTTFSSTLGFASDVGALTPEPGAFEGFSAAPGFRASIGLPSRGHLDRHHDAAKLIARPAEAGLYAVRNVLVEDLLRTRAGLRALLNRPAADFVAPPALRELYLDPSDSGVELSAVTDLVRELERAGRPGASRATWEKLAAGLLFYSAQVVQAERVLRFIGRDWYADPRVRDAFRAEVLLPHRASFARIPHEQRRHVDLDEEAKKLWIRAHGVDRQMAEWAGLREALLNRYPVLAFRKDGQPLYARLYAAGRRHGLPDPLAPLRAESPGLPAAGRDISITVEQIEDGMRPVRAIVASADVAQYPGADPALAPAVLRDTGALIAESLAQALAANTELLERLAAEPHWRGDEDALIFRAADHEALWREARRRYGYLGAFIDFDRAEREVRGRHAELRARRQKVELALWGTGAALALATGGAALGAEGVLLGLSAETVGFAASGFFAASSLYAYLDRREVAEIARAMFRAQHVRPLVSPAEAHDAEVRADDEFREMLISAAMMAFMPTLGALMRSSEALVAQGAERGRRLVRSSRSAMDSLRARLARMGEGEIRFATPGGAAERARLRRAAGLKDPAGSRISLEQAVAETARAEGVTPASVWARLGDLPGIERFRRAWNAKQAATGGQFRKFLIAEEIAGLCVDTAGDYFGREWDWGKWAEHVITGAVANFLIVWRFTGLRRIELPSSPTRIDRIRRVDAMFRQASVGLYTSGLMAGGGTTAVKEAWKHFQDPESNTWSQSARQIATNGAIWASYMGVSSAVRYQFVVGPINERIGMKLAQRAERLRHAGLPADRGAQKLLEQTAIWPVSLLNGFFGSWMYVEAVEAVAGSADAETAQEIRREGGLWIAAERPAAGAAEVFDFLAPASAY